eukprot:11162952-Lingulodinium_polyedra.AAC.1
MPRCDQLATPAIRQRAPGHGFSSRSVRTNLFAEQARCAEGLVSVVCSGHGQVARCSADFLGAVKRHRFSPARGSD